MILLHRKHFPKYGADALRRSTRLPAAPMTHGRQQKQWDCVRKFIFIFLRRRRLEEMPTLASISEFLLRPV